QRGRLGGIRSKEHQPAAGDIDPEGVDRRHSMASSQINDQFAMHTRQPMGNKHAAKARELSWQEGKASLGGLLGYGEGVPDAYRLGRILKGEKPGELPVQQCTKVQMFLNLKAAKDLG